MGVNGTGRAGINRPERRIRVLRLLLEIVETNAPYQELSRPLAKKQDITLCSYFRSAVEVPDDLRLFEGDGTVRGFFRALHGALREGGYDVIHAETPHVAFLFLLGHGMNRRLMASTVFTVSNSYRSWKTRNKLLLLPAFAFFHRVVCCGEACFAINGVRDFGRWRKAKTTASSGGAMRTPQNGQRMPSTKHAAIGGLM